MTVLGDRVSLDVKADVQGRFDHAYLTLNDEALTSGTLASDYGFDVGRTRLGRVYLLVYRKRSP